MKVNTIIVLLLLNASALLAESPRVPTRDGEKHIVVVTCSFNNQKWVNWNLTSVLEQQYDNYHVVYLDDKSDDLTFKLAKKFITENGLEDRFILIQNKDRHKALANLYSSIHMCAPTDIIAVLDGDDRFAQEKVLIKLNAVYENSNIWLTYGQFRVHGGFPFHCSPYPQSIINRCGFRYHPPTPSHLRTFYAGLFHKIRKDDLLFQGDFFPMTYDLAMMFPMIEMARTHFQFIADILVDYNNANPLNDHKVNKQMQRKFDLIIRARTCYQEIDSLF